jgi:hypothetical protein
MRAWETTPAMFMRTDLQLLGYSESDFDTDDPRSWGIPDSIVFDRNEISEVLPFINVLMRLCRRTSLDDGRKLERMIRSHPAHLRTRKTIGDWIVANWHRY